jgi:hypothetical protein
LLLFTVSSEHVFILHFNLAQLYFSNKDHKTNPTPFPTTIFALTICRQQYSSLLIFSNNIAVFHRFFLATQFSLYKYIPNKDFLTTLDFGQTLVSIWDQFGATLGSLRYKCGVTLGLLWDYFGITLVSLLGHFDHLGVTWGHFGYLLLFTVSSEHVFILHFNLAQYGTCWKDVCST